jgi:hypothetical protein
MAFTYTYTPGSTANLDRLRFLLGDHRGVPAAYGTAALWLSTSQALYTDEELNDLLAATMCNNDIMSSARIAVQNRINREAYSAGVAGTTDTTDRPAAIINALRALATLTYPLRDQLPGSAVTTNAAIDSAGLTDMGDLE